MVLLFFFCFFRGSTLPISTKWNIAEFMRRVKPLETRQKQMYTRIYDFLYMFYAWCWRINFRAAPTKKINHPKINKSIFSTTTKNDFWAEMCMGLILLILLAEVKCSLLPRSTLLLFRSCLDSFYYLFVLWLLVVVGLRFSHCLWSANAKKTHFEQNDKISETKRR